jgi:Bacteriophage protein gp37
MLLTKRAERMHHFITDEFAHSWLGASWPEVTKQASVDLKIDAPWPLPNVWLGVTVCNQAEADAKLPVLLQTPAAKRFVSVEPMLGPVEIGKYLYGSYECALSCGHRQAFTDPPEKQCTKCGFTGPDDYATWGDGSCEECPKCGQDGCCGEIEEICPDCGTYMVREHPDTPNIDWVIAGPETGPKARAANEVWFRSLRDQCHADYCKTPFFLKKNSDGSRLLDGREWNEVPS